jgi:chitinase
MTPQSPKPSCHDVMTGQWTPSAADLAAGRRPGFGQTINIINGGIECSYALDTPPRPAPANVQDRLRFYASFTARLGVAPGDNVDCGSMRRY